MKNLSESVRFFEKAFDLANKEFFENALPKVMITVQSSPKAYGHFTTAEIWKDTAKAYHEINISAEALNRPVQETIATLIHEMVHLYCSENKIKDTSRGGTYHNKIFKTEGEKRGIKISYDKKNGYSPTAPTERLLTFIQENKLDKAITCHRDKIESAHSKAKKKTSTRKYECPCCGMTVRATKAVNIICADCQEAMKAVS